ncbi:hypothetical protein D3C87_1102620 [compost metagenome]
MSEQITWTHVDKLVRKMHDEEGLLPVGNTDAEIAYNFVKFLMNVRTKAEQDYRRASERYYSREGELMRLEQQLKAEREKPAGKTKQRLAKLEAAVVELQAKEPQA